MLKKWLSTTGRLLAVQLIACGSEGSSGSLSDAPNGSAASPTGQVGEAIVNGSTDSADRAVLAIALVTRQEEALCSGSLIAPNLVLTARHCVAATADTTVVCGQSTFGNPYAPGDLFVSDATTAGAGSFYPTREIAVPSNDSELCGSDLALLILDGQFQAGSVTALEPRLEQPVQSGEVFSAVGFGDALDAGPAGVRRMRSGLQILCGPNDCDDPKLLTGGEFVGQQAVCEGDSGGPALDTEGRVVGVASRATEDCDLAVYSAVATWRDWIRGVAARALQSGTYAAPAWETNNVTLPTAGSAPTSGTSSPANMPSSASEPSVVTPATAGGDTPAASSQHASSGCDLSAAATGDAARFAGYAALALLFAARRFRRQL